MFTSASSILYEKIFQDDVQVEMYSLKKPDVHDPCNYWLEDCCSFC